MRLPWRRARRGTRSQPFGGTRRGDAGGAAPPQFAKPPEFSSTELLPGKPFREVMTFRFSTDKI